jgi:hypothetical protein
MLLHFLCVFCPAISHRPSCIITTIMHFYLITHANALFSLTGHCYSPSSLLILRSAFLILHVGVYSLQSIGETQSEAASY